MMNRSAPTLAKWPFFLSDVLLLGLAWWVASRGPPPLTGTSVLLVVACVAGAAGFGVAPFLIEYRAQLRFAEAGALVNAVSQIEKLQTVGDHIRQATAQWHTIEDQSARAAAAAREVGEQLTSEAKAFAEFLQKTNDSEKAHLRLEVEKLHRAEGDWLQLLVRLLDHVYALHQGGARSGQPALIEQLGRFQFACYDTVRRVGLVPIEARPGDPFDEQKHQLPEPDTSPPAGAIVAGTLATGYSFQGQLLRRPVVRLVAPTSAGAASSPAPGATGNEPAFEEGPGPGKSVGAVAGVDEPPPEKRESFRLE